MATRDEIIRFIIQTQGADGIEALSKSLKDTGAAGAEAEPEVRALVDELGRLADSDKAVSGFVSLKAELAEVETQLGVAKNNLDELTASFDRNDTSNKRITASFALADKTIASLTARQSELAVELAKTSGALDKAGIDANSLTDAQARPGVEAAAAAEKLRLIAAASAENATAEKAEALSVEELGERYAAFGRVLETLKTLAVTIGGLFAFEKAKEELGDILATGDKFERWGVQFANAFGGSEQGAEALEKVKELAESTPLSLDDLTEAAIKAKKGGLDPLNGTLETLVNVNAKYGGSIDSLNSLIDDFSKANAKGELSEKQLVTMQQNGVPAAQLLGAAMGKTADQILDMANKGQLGRDSIALLLKQLASSSSGAAQASMGLLSTQVVKLHDQWDEFLALIGKSGVYDFAREELKEIGEALEKGLGDGSLKERAQAISDGIVGIGKAALGTLSFLGEHASELKTVAEGYLLIRAAQLSVDLAGMVAKFTESTAAALANAAAAQRDAAAQVELAAAMRAASLAAGTQAAAVGASEVALDTASKGGILRALASFGSLRGALNGVGTTLTSLVGGPIPALIASIAYLAFNTVELVKNLTDWYNITQRLNDLQKENAETQTALGAKAAQVAQQTRDAANIQVLAAQDVAAMSRKQSDAYIKQLQDAIRYYTALKILAQQSGNKSQVDEDTEKLKVYEAALAEVEKQAKETAEEGSKGADAQGASIDELVRQIQNYRIAGVAAPIAVEGAFKGIKIDEPSGLDKILQIFPRIKLLSGDTGNAFQSQLVNKLAGLDDLQFEQFKANLADAMQKGQASTSTFKTVIDAVTQVSMLKLGLSAEQTGQKFTESGGKIIGAFGAIARNADLTGEQIQTAFAKALSQAQTEGEVKRLQQDLQAAFNGGKISADQFTVASEAAARKLTSIEVESAKASAGLDGVGKAGETASERTVTALDDMRSKLVAQAAVVGDQIAALIKNGDPLPADLLAKYKALQDQINGITGAINAEAASAKGALNAVESLATAQAGVRAAADNAAYAAGQQAKGEQTAKDYSEALKGIGDQSKNLGDRYKDLQTATDNTTSATERSQVAVAGMGLDMEKNAGIAQYLAQAMEGARQEFVAISPAAASAFDTIVAGALEAQGIMKEGVQTTDASKTALEGLKEEAQNDFGGGGFSKYFYALEQATEDTRAAIAAEQTDVDNLASKFKSFADSSNASLDSMGSHFGVNLEELERMDQQLQDGTYNAGLLGQQNLAGLQQAVEAAIAKVQALKDAAKAANDQFVSLASSIHDDLLQQLGDQAALENERDQNIQSQLLALKQAGQVSDAQYQKALADEQQLHALKMKDIADQAAAQKNSSASGGSNGSGAPAGSSGGANNPRGPGAGSPSTAASGPSGLPTGVQPLHYHLSDGSQATLYGDAANANKVWNGFVDELTRARINSI